jgi:hypothetical protein
MKIKPLHNNVIVEMVVKNDWIILSITNEERNSKNVYFVVRAVWPKASLVKEWDYVIPHYPLLKAIPEYIEWEYYCIREDNIDAILDEKE